MWYKTDYKKNLISLKGLKDQMTKSITFIIWKRKIFWKVKLYTRWSKYFLNDCHLWILVKRPQYGRSFKIYFGNILKKKGSDRFSTNYFLNYLHCNSCTWSNFCWTLKSRIVYYNVKQLKRMYSISSYI